MLHSIQYKVCKVPKDRLVFLWGPWFELPAQELIRGYTAGI
jgi:hypothetical protein